MHMARGLRDWTIQRRLHSSAGRVTATHGVRAWQYDRPFTPTRAYALPPAVLHDSYWSGMRKGCVIQVCEHGLGPNNGISVYSNEPTPCSHAEGFFFVPRSIKPFYYQTPWAGFLLPSGCMNEGRHFESYVPGHYRPSYCGGHGTREGGQRYGASSMLVLDYTELPTE